MSASKSYLLDMDGVLLRGNQPVPGAQQFIERLTEAGAKFAVLTNNPMYTPRDLQYRLANAGLSVPAERLFTSAMATAQFLHSQMPKGSAFAIGESGLTSALHDVGYVLTEQEPDYVVLGETTNYSFERIAKAVRLVAAGARFIATNPDPVGPTDRGIEPACGAMAALIEAATSVKAYFVGKPNPLMMRTALNHLDVHSEDTIMVGDTMATDIKGGVEAGMETILVLSGVTQTEDVARFPFQPTRIVDSVADIVV